MLSRRRGDSLATIGTGHCNNKSASRRTSLDRKADNAKKRRSLLRNQRVDGMFVFCMWAVAVTFYRGDSLATIGTGHCNNKSASRRISLDRKAEIAKKRHSLHRNQSVSYVGGRCHVSPEVILWRRLEQDVATTRQPHEGYRSTERRKSQKSDIHCIVIKVSMVCPCFVRGQSLSCFSGGWIVNFRHS